MGLKAIAGLSHVQFEETRPGRYDASWSGGTPWTINVDDQELVTLLCTPDKLNVLVLGFLSAEGLDRGPRRRDVVAGV